MAAAHAPPRLLFDCPWCSTPPLRLPAVLAHPHPPSWPTELLCAPWPPVSQIKTCMPVEEHASSVLTPHAFEVFQKELVSSTQFAVYETQRDAYLVRHHLKTDGGHLVSCIPANEERCGHGSGMMCRHSLRVLALKNCFMLPEKYLLIRWRRESSLFPKSSGYKYRSQALRSLASIIIQESSLTKDRFDYVKWHMSKLLTHVRDMPTVDEGASDLEPVSSLDATVDVATVVGCNGGSAKTLGSLPPPCPAPSISFSSSLKEREGAVDTGSGGGGAEGAGVLEALH